MEETIDLIEYFAIIKKRFWIVILTTVIAVGISVIIFHLNKEQLYEAEKPPLLAAFLVGGSFILE